MALARFLSLLLSLAISPLVFAQDAAPTDHSATCPKSCNKCSEMIKKSLDWLASQQLPEGNWKSGNGGMWTTTAFAVVAFHAHGSTLKDGPHAAAVRKAVDYIVEQAPIAQKKYPLMNWDVGFFTLAVAEAYAHHPDEKLRKFLEWCADLIGKNQQIGVPASDIGGWGHLSVNYGIKRELTMYGMFTAPSLWNVAALGVLRQLGIAVDEEMLRRGVNYLRSATNKDGGVGYYGTKFEATKVSSPEAGRAGGLIWALDRAGATDSTIVPRIADWFAPRLKSVPHGHAAVILHYLHGALAVKLIGEPTRSEFWKIWRNQIFKEYVESDGYFRNRWMKEDKFAWWGEIGAGNNFSAAVYPLVLMILGDTSNLKTWFNPVKPFTAPVPDALAARFNAPAAPAPQTTARNTPTPSPTQKNQQDDSHGEPPVAVVGDDNKIFIPRPPPRDDAQPFLGANFQAVEGRGLLIVALADLGSLARAGLEAGDLVTHFNNQPVKSAEDIVALVEAVKVGDTIAVKFQRGRTAKSVDVKLVGEP
jgi:hypothetical protein